MGSLALGGAVARGRDQARRRTAQCDVLDRRHIQSFRRGPRPVNVRAMKRSDDALQLRLGTRINSVRNERGLTQAQLAEEVGIEARSLQRIEAGRTTPSIPRLCAIAEVLGVTPGALLDGTVAPKKGTRASNARDAAPPLSRDDASAALLRAWDRVPAPRRRLALKMLRLLASERLE